MSEPPARLIFQASQLFQPSGTQIPPLFHAQQAGQEATKHERQGITTRDVTGNSDARVAQDGPATALDAIKNRLGRVSGNDCADGKPPCCSPDANHGGIPVGYLSARRFRSAPALRENCFGVAPERHVSKPRANPLGAAPKVRKLPVDLWQSRHSSVVRGPMAEIESIVFKKKLRVERKFWPMSRDPHANAGLSPDQRAKHARS
ncbi:hypothetical protein [Roseobacter fucihabitans]|uniref:hypothetical protein n=1 Tax=Roseobacter fucihabitans TaxID=1537242 RepID=UPI0016530613|nr:hypothetical protein [Roseobacter litoralis]